MSFKAKQLEQELCRVLTAAEGSFLFDSQTEVQAAEAEYEPIGTEKTGYVGPEYGPFCCDNCKHYQASTETEQMGLCDHPDVIADESVTKCKDGDKAWVHEAACCNEFRTKEMP